MVSRYLARVLRALLHPRDMSVEWLEAHDRTERDTYDGPRVDWTTAPAAFTAARALPEERR